MSIQPLNDRMPLVNPDGTPTQFFLRQLQDRGITIDGKITAEQAAEIAQGLIDDWAAARDINTTAPILGGGNLSTDLTISHDVSGVTPGTYGDATNSPQITVDDEGHVTNVTNVPISGGGGGGAGVIYRPQIEGLPSNTVSLVGTQIFTPVYLTAGDEVTGIATAASSAITMNSGGALYGPTGLVAFGSGFNLVADSGIASTSFTANALKIFPVSYTVPTTGRYWISIYAGSAYSAFARPGSGIMYKSGTLTSFPSTTAAPTNVFTAGGTGFLVGTFA